MTIRLRNLMLWLLVLSLFTVLSPVSAQTEPPQEVCEHYLERFYAEPDWREQLLDPVYSSTRELVDRYNLYLPVHECLSNAEIPVTGEAAEARDLTGFYVTLVGGIVNPTEGQAGQGGSLRFSDLQDPAIVALRDEVGLPDPEGFFFVWLYPSVEDMPDNLETYFSNPNVRGLTLLTRYIIILDSVSALGEDQQDSTLADYQRDQLNRVFSHEYVHAYIKSLLGPEQAFDLPKWFDEGLAIYFSGSSEPSSLIYMNEQGHRVLITTAPEEYARYRDTFKYLEQAHGRERFLELLREAVLTHNPDLLYRDLGVENEQALFAQAESSRQQQGLERLAYLVLLLAAAVLLFMLLARTRRRVPAYSAGVGPRDPLNAYYMQMRGDLRGLERMLSTDNQSTAPADIQSRLAAAEALADMIEPRAVEILAKSVCEDRSSSVRAAAARGLGRLGDLHRRTSPLEARPRARAMSVLFPVLRSDPSEEVRMMAMEALFYTGGTAVIRPLEALLRREVVMGKVSPAFQNWLVEWAVRSELEGLVMDLYPWLGESARRKAVSRMRWRLTPYVLERLGQARDSGDPDLQELANGVLGSAAPEEETE